MCLHTHIVCVIQAIMFSGDGSIPVPPAADHDPCSGSWNNSACHVNWTVKGDCISFCVSVNSRGWVGLGFSLDQFMVLFYYQLIHGAHTVTPYLAHV